MSYQTLHQCNYCILSKIDTYLDLVGSDDGIVFYTDTMTRLQHNKLKNNPKIKHNDIYFIIDNNHDNLPTISYSDWVDLVDMSNRTFTWK
ncbi:hypothetical protein MNBD_GAMMA01-1581 [hydrothermal vent metagenome]|uniref:Uncharacterized protein n=1 Tax=hydrothermal vent metagenome TaxID=652676 RepID=A0A3B0V1I8_9ZZZZ